jgi:hypothetical protein
MRQLRRVCVCARVDPESNAGCRSGEGRGRWIDILQVLGGLQHTHCVGGWRARCIWQSSGSRVAAEWPAADSRPRSLLAAPSHHAMPVQCQCSVAMAMAQQPPRTDAVRSPQLQMIFPRHATQRSGALGRCGRLSSTRHPRLARESARLGPGFCSRLRAQQGREVRIGGRAWAGVGGLLRATAAPAALRQIQTSIGVWGASLRPHRLCGPCPSSLTLTPLYAARCCRLHRPILSDRG